MHIIFGAGPKIFGAGKIYGLSGGGGNAQIIWRWARLERSFLSKNPHYFQKVLIYFQKAFMLASLNLQASEVCKEALGDP